MTRTFALFVTPLLLALCQQAAAQSATTQMPEGTSDVEISAIAALVPQNEGRSAVRLVVVPAVSVQFSNGIFLAPGEVGMQISEDPMLKYGPLLNYGTRARRADDPSDRVRFGVEGGAFARYRLAYNIGFGAQILYGGSDERRGVRMHLGADYSLHLGTHQSMVLGLGATLADAAYLQSYFGVDAAQATRTGLPAYDAHGGMKNISGSIGWNIQLSNKFSLSSGMTVSRLQGSAAKSPLVLDQTSTVLFSRLGYHY